MDDSKRSKVSKWVKLSGTTPHRKSKSSDAAVYPPAAMPVVRQDVAEYRVDVPRRAESVVQDLAKLKEKRRAALAKTFGLFRDTDVFPMDGLEFEREMREEW